MQPTSILDAGMLTGRQQAFAMIATKCSYAQAVCLKEIHDTGSYREFGLNWNDYCPKHLGISRVTADTIIHRVDEFGEAYFRLAAITRISDNLFREIADRAPAATIELDGEQVPLVPDNAQKIRAGIRRLQDEVRRLSNQFRVPTKIVEIGMREDDVLKAIAVRARLGRALPNDEAAGIRSLAHHSMNKWSEILDMLKVDA